MQFFAIFWNDIIKFIIPFLLANELIGLINLPITSLVFKRFKQFAAVLSSAFGWIFLSFLVFLTASVFSTYNILNIYTVIACLFVLAVTNLIIYQKNKTLVKSNLVLNPIWTRLFFIGLFFTLYFFVARNAEIYQIERFMDFGFIQTLLNVRTLPLQDLWMSGTNLNYYYFGHFIGYIMCMVTRLKAEQIFFLATCWTYATCGIGIYYLGKYILEELISSGTYLRNFKTSVGGIIGVIFFCFSGPIHSVLWFLKQAKHFWYGGEAPFFWYAEAARIIPGTIGEFPLFSFLEASMHGHMWGFLIAVLVIAILIDSYYDESFRFSLYNIRLYILSFLLGVSFMTNTWDLISLGLLSIFVLTLMLLLSFKKVVWIDFFMAILLNIALFIVIALPWYLSFKSPIEGLGLVTSPSEFKLWFELWGGFFIILILFTLYWIFASVRKLLDENLQNKLGLVWMIYFGAAFLILFLEIAHLNDILHDGEWSRANSYFKIGTQIWTWLSIVSGVSLVFLYDKIKNKFGKGVILIVGAFLISICGLIYPIKTFQYFHTSKYFSGIANPMSWLGRVAAPDYEAYTYLNNYKNSLPQRKKLKIIVEGAGDSYHINNYFSVMLGWPAVIGWPVHEWTWRGALNDVDPRRADVNEIYKGKNVETSKELLRQYGVDFIIVGIAEKRIYEEELNYEKLSKLGTVVFRNGETIILRVLGNIGQ
ncbi:hypothetical protein HYV31_01890 [candidate division WWE3 bacterium]|nr:hypothetical protein [candidate division WWE3 bacterium]